MRYGGPGRRKAGGAFQVLTSAAATAMLLPLLCCTAQTGAGDASHHTRSGFMNPHLTEQPGLLDFLKWRWERLGKGVPGRDDYHFPLAKNDPALLGSNREKTTLTWIGHATILLQVGGVNVLTDPHFSRRASPVQWAGPERVVPPGISLTDLPPIHAVVISHDHYDSLDTGTIRALHDREGGADTLFIVPLGLKKWFEELGVRNVVEMDWWERLERSGLAVTAVPVQHWGKRSPFSRNENLWAGWVVQAGDFRFFFAGDSGYCPHFKEIGEKLGPFDLAAIPIGAYEPRWFMKAHHMSPEEAVQVHLDVRSRKSVAIHWGTFILTDEPLDEPPRRLSRALDAKGIARDSFVVLRHGETMMLD